MQRFHNGSCNGAVNSSQIGGLHIRDSRAESPIISPNHPHHLRRPSPPSRPYRLRCDKEHLNSRLGPPDFYPQNPNCLEETLTREHVQHGYRETIEGLEESREVSLSQCEKFTTPVIFKCKEVIRKRNRAINESRAQKRKVGQVYDVPLSGTLLTKSTEFPEQRPCGEDFKKKWIECLSQPHKRLCSFADHVPHGYRRKSLLEVLIRNNVPLLRASWFIKVIYLNQVRASSNSSSGFHENAPLSRSEHWTKDVIEYLQYLLDEHVTRKSFPPLHMQDRSSQVAYTGSMQRRGDSISASVVGNGASLYAKWQYIMRIILWHHAEGLIIPSLIIEWVLTQLQEKQLHEVLQLMLPIIYAFMEAAVLSQSYVRSLVGISVRYIREPSPRGSDVVDNSRRTYAISAVVEMLRYLIRTVPETFVALDCFPLPPCVVNGGGFFDDAGKLNDGKIVVNGVFPDKSHEVQADSSFRTVVSSIRKRAKILSKASRGCGSYNVAKALQVLDQAVSFGDISFAYKKLFKNLNGACGERWISEVSPSIYASLKHIGSVKLSLTCSIFCICEWATCEYRDFHMVLPHGTKFTGRRDFSPIFIAVRLLKVKMIRMRKLYASKRKIYDISDTCKSPGPLHDVIVCWLDQHEVHNREGFKRLQLLIRGLIQEGVFSPQAYVKQLIVSGIMDGNVPAFDVEHRNRHYNLLKQLPALYVHDALTRAQISLPPQLEEEMNVYRIERRMLLHEVLSGQRKPCPDANRSCKKQKHQSGSGSGVASPYSVDRVHIPAVASTRCGTDNKLEMLKASISALLNLPHSSPSIQGVLVGHYSQGSISELGGANNRTENEDASASEECPRVKRQKVNEQCSSFMLPCPTNEEETWWLRQGANYVESRRAELPPKPPKKVPRGRQKPVRKTLSLAHLSTPARTEDSQGASTTHLCENIGCPRHRTGLDEISKSVDGNVKPPVGDIQLIGKLLKQMRLVEKRAVTAWLISAVKQLIEDAEKLTAKVVQYGNRSLAPADDKSSIGWRLGEEEVSAMLYIMDTCDDLPAVAEFLLWLLPKVPNTPGLIMHNQNNVMLPRIAENHACDVGEAFLLSCFRRYENVFAAVGLLSKTLSAVISRSSAILASNGNLSGSLSLGYTRHLLKKYNAAPCVRNWANTFKSTSDERLVSELESSRSLEVDFHPLGVSNGADDLDDHIRQKINGVGASRFRSSMKDIVHRHIDEVFQYYTSKDQNSSGLGHNKTPSVEKLDDVYHVAQKVVTGLLDSMRQIGGAAQEGNPSLVSSAVAALIDSAGLIIARLPDFSSLSNQTNSPQPSGSLHLAQRVLRVHIACLSLFKEALGECHSRVFEVALATEASSALMQAFEVPGKSSSSTQFQMSPETHDFNPSLPTEPLNHSSKSVRTCAAVSAVIVGAIIQGVATLERMVTLFRLKESLDLTQFVKSLISNGNARTVGIFKVANLIEVSVNWFRVLMGNCRTACDGLILELLGEPSIVALSRMQRMLPLNMVFPPAYSIFAFVIWKPILEATVGTHEALQRLDESLAVSVDDAIKHHPFREICLRDTRGLYDLIAADTLDPEFVTLLGSDVNLKASSCLVSLRSRLFLDALLTCRMPETIFSMEDMNWASSLSGLKRHCGDNVKNHMGKLVHSLDTLQPARFHWQWLELRLLLNEQAVNEKIENHSIVEAIRFLSPSHDKTNAFDNEGNFIQIVLTRLLVRPDAAPLFSEVVHLLGKSVEDSMLSQAKWLLGGNEVLFGKKSIRQKVLNIASELKGLSMKPPYWKPWGWCRSDSNAVSRGDKLKPGTGPLEEGEFVDEGTYANRSGQGSGILDMEGFIVSQQHVTERALVELILPCVDQCSDKLRHNFASEMVKQVSDIEHQINSGKSTVTPISGIRSPVHKSNNKKRGKDQSLAISRQSLSGSSDMVPPSPAALRASMTLRLQFLLRLLPIICADREPSNRNMRYDLASVILRLLGSRVVFEDSCHLMNPALMSSKRDVKSFIESSASILFGQNLFDCLLLVLHLLVGSHQPIWLKSKSKSKSQRSDHSKDYTAFDREVAKSLQNELDHMELPKSIRFRIQTAMPCLFPSVRCSVSCAPPTLSENALTCLQPRNAVTALNPLQKNPSSLVRDTILSKTKPQQPLQNDNEMEIDRWTLLEDGTGSSQTGSNPTDANNDDNCHSKAAFWLKGAVRVRRTDLTYIGAADDDSRF